MSMAIQAAAWGQGEAMALWGPHHWAKVACAQIVRHGAKCTAKLAGHGVLPAIIRSRTPSGMSRHAACVHSAPHPCNRCSPYFIRKLKRPIPAAMRARPAQGAWRAHRCWLGPWPLPLRACPRLAGQEACTIANALTDKRPAGLCERLVSLRGQGDHAIVHQVEAGVCGILQGLERAQGHAARHSPGGQHAARRRAHGRAGGEGHGAWLDGGRDGGVSGCTEGNVRRCSGRPGKMRRQALAGYAQPVEKHADRGSGRPLSLHSHK